MHLAWFIGVVTSARNLSPAKRRVSVCVRSVNICNMMCLHLSSELAGLSGKVFWARFKEALEAKNGIFFYLQKQSATLCIF